MSQLYLRISALFVRFMRYWVNYEFIEVFDLYFAGRNLLVVRLTFKEIYLSVSRLFVWLSMKKGGGEFYFWVGGWAFFCFYSPLPLLCPSPLSNCLPVPIFSPRVR